MEQFFNLRCGIPPELENLDEALYRREVHRALARQKVRFAVAPRVTVSTKRGVLESGAEITLEDIELTKEQRLDGNAPWQVFERLVRAGYVLEK
jgi:hypothetical protein